MARVDRAILDAGPLIHLQQIGALRVLDVIRTARVSEEVRAELGAGFRLPANCRVEPLSGGAKNLCKAVSERYGIALGEASAIALCKQLAVKLLFTDDLTAREAAKGAGLEAHGTLALVARAYRERVLTKKQALGVLDDLRVKSTLYLTSDLVSWARKHIETTRF